VGGIAAKRVFNESSGKEVFTIEGVGFEKTVPSIIR